MTDQSSHFINRLAELRRAFDGTFAEAPSPDSGDLAGFLGVHVGGDAYACALDAIVGLFADKKVVPMPSVVPELLGIAGIRGAIVPVYSLRGLLGYPVERECPRWLALARSDDPVGLAFEQFAGYLQIRPSDFVPAPRTEGTAAHIRGTLRAEQTAYAVLSIPAILETLGKGRAHPGGPWKEQ